jgi:hypothetical protein
MHGPKPLRWRFALRLALAGLMALGLPAGTAPAQAAAPPSWSADGPAGNFARAAAAGVAAAGHVALERRAGQLRLSPANDYNCVLPGGGCVRSYRSGQDPDLTIALYWSPVTGAHAMELDHPVGRKFAATGYERGTYGFPTSEMECGVEGLGCVQYFEHGRIDQAYIAAGHQALAAKAARLQLSGAGGYNCALVGDGCVRSYTTSGGRHIAIYWSAATGAQAVDMDHDIGGTFAAATYERGRYGYPVSDMVCAPGSGCRQKFQHGTITFSFDDAGARALDAKAAALKLEPAGGYECQLAADGCRRSYTAPGAKAGAAGRQVDIYWSETTGAHTVDMSHGIGREYARAGLEAGRYGYPTSEMMCSGNGCTQLFQKGTINLPADN